MEFTIYVSPKGSDEGDGTESNPIQTLSRAQKLVQNHPERQKSTIRIKLFGGMYELQEPLYFSAVDSGSSNAPVIWDSNDDDPAVLSASQLTHFSWELYDERRGIFVTLVPDPFRAYFSGGVSALWMESEKLHLARFPNFAGDYDFKGNGVSEEAIHATRVQTWKNPKGGWIHGLSHHEWGSVHYKITGKKDETNLILEQLPTINREAALHPRFRFVENVWEELDCPGEYYFDEERMLLFLIPPNEGEKGIDALNQAKFRIASGSRIISIVGTESEPACNLQFKNLHFRYTKHSLDQHWEPLTRGDWSIVREGGIFVSGAENVEFGNCTFQDIATNAAFISNYNRNIKIEGCEFANIGESGICFVGNHQSVRSAAIGYHHSIPYSEMDVAPGPLNTNFPAHCIVKDCLIHEIGQITKQTAGIFLSMAQQITIDHSTIFHCPRAGICINEGAFGGHKIQNNFIFDTVRETGDHGPFNSWGRDRHWKDTHANNPKKEVPENVRYLSTLDMSTTEGELLPNRIENNRFEHSSILHSSGLISGAFSWGIDLDDGSSNYILRNNLCIGCSFKLREGFNRLVENNIIISPIPPEKHQQYLQNGDIIRQNIIFNTHDSSPFKLTLNGLPQDAQEIDKNLYFSQRGAIDLSYPHQNGIELHSIFADPEFVDPQNWDFQLKPTSPAFSLGFKAFPMDDFGSQIEKHKQATHEYYKEYRKNKSGMDLLTAKLDTIQEWMGAILKDISTEQEKSATGMHAITGIIVVSIEKNSLATQIGLQENDVIIRLNGSEIPDIATFQEILLQAESQDESKLGIFRYQKEIELEL